jgi:hypothetical protein
MSARVILQRLAVTCGLIYSAVGLTNPARATWSNYAPMDPGLVPVFSDYSCASAPLETAQCTAIDNFHLLRVLTYSHGTWSVGPELGTEPGGPPSCASAAGGTVACATAQATDMAFEVPGVGELSVSSGDLIVGRPSCVAQSAGIVFCAGTTATRGIVGYTFESAGPKVAVVSRHLPETLYSPAGCAEDGLGHAVCGWTAATSNVIASANLGALYNYQWFPDVNLGGSADGPISCAYAGVPGDVTCYGIAIDHYAYARSYAGGSWDAASWTAWGAITAAPVSGIGCAGQAMVEGAPGLVCVYIEAGNSQLFGAVGNFNGLLETAHAFGPITAGGKAEPTAWTGNPSCTTIDYSIQPPKVLCVMRRVNDGLFYAVTGP